MQEAARKFASNLLALYKNIRGVVNLREDLSHAELTVGRFGGIDVRIVLGSVSFSCKACPAEFVIIVPNIIYSRLKLQALAQEYGQGMAKQGMDVLLATLSKLFNLLETSHKGEMSL